MIKVYKNDIIYITINNTMSDTNTIDIKKKRNAEYQRKFRANLDEDTKEKINIEKAKAKRDKYNTDEEYKKKVNEANKQKALENRALAKTAREILNKPPPVVAPPPVSDIPYHCIYCNHTYTDKSIKKHLASIKHGVNVKLFNIK